MTRGRPCRWRGARLPMLGRAARPSRRTAAATGEPPVDETRQIECPYCDRPAVLEAWVMPPTPDGAQVGLRYSCPTRCELTEALRHEFQALFETRRRALGGSSSPARR